MAPLPETSAPEASASGLPASADPAADAASPETLLSAEALESLAVPGALLITFGSLPDRERFARSFTALARMEDCADFARVAALAKSRPPVLDGALRPNYLMASAAEEKRRAQGIYGAAGESQP